jgi:hypothetical protein
MYQTDNFDRTAPARVTHDAAANSWTLSNAAVSRTVRWDAKAGGLQPGALLLNGKPAGARVVSEGRVTLTPPLPDRPGAISKGWKLTDSKPSANWAKPDFDDAAWKAQDLPFTTQEENRSWWFRYHIPAGRLKPGIPNVVVLDHSADEAAEVFVDGHSVGVMPAAQQPWTKTYQFSLPVKAKVIAIRLDGLGKPNGLKNVSIGEAGKDIQLDLSHGWTLAGHKEGPGTLTLGLSGAGANKGFDVSVRYRVVPGDEPIVTKSITVTGRAGDMYLLKEAVVDGLEATGAVTGVQGFTGSGNAVSTDKGGFVTSALHLQGASDVLGDGKAVNTVYRPYVPVTSGKPVSTPETVLGLYDGPTAKGGYLLQLYIGAHVSHATPTMIPPLYSTWFGYYNTITGDEVQQMVKPAAELGVKYFSIDDGWQQIVGSTKRGYGDWIENKEFFPKGLKPIADEVRERGMKFGLWTAPIMVHNESGVSKQHPEWKIRHADGSGLPLWDGTTAECFSGAYAKHFEKTLLGLCKELDIQFLKLDGGLYEGGCVAKEHGHPVSYSEGAQIQAWKDLCATLRKEVPGVIIDRGWEGEPGLTAYQDTAWFGDWILAFRPEREADMAWWYRNADVYRRTLYDMTFTRPAFTISWEAACHILAKPEDLNALEYHFTSIGAYICNVELHGRILEMTPGETALMKKWVKWNWDNRDWLAVAQPITALGKPYDALAETREPHVDGVMHLRNALKGRYGYVCLWNPGETAQTVDVTIRPSDYYLKMDTATVAATRFKDGAEIKASRASDAVTLHIPIGPRGWEIVELREPAAK